MAEPEATVPSPRPEIDLNKAARQVFQLWVDLAVIDRRVTQLSAAIADAAERIAAHQD
ncbi:MAG TPA: hypothetical protein VLR26_02105 [Frankiaceae bacterium]|nr:hypothetical protein [Frankiaceae bacterium]